MDAVRVSGCSARGRRTGSRLGAYGKFVLGCPFGSFFFHDCLQLEESGKRDCSRGRGDIERRVGGKPKERAELSSKGGGEIIPGVAVVEDATIWRLCEVGTERHRAAKLLNFSEVAALEMGELPAGVFKSLLLA